MAERDLDLSGLRLFHRVAECGNLTRAAAEMKLTQPAASHQIRRLEEGLGVTLFRRRHRGMTPTAEGEILQRAVGVALGEIDRAAREIRRRDRAPALRLLTDFGFATFRLMPRLAELRGRHPGMNVHIVVSQSLEAGGDDEADVSVIFGRRADFGAEARSLMPERVVPVCTPGYLARHGPFESATGLARATLLHLGVGQGPRWFTWESLLAAHGVKRAAAADDLHLGTYALVIQAALAEQGVALGWLGLVDDLLASGALVPLLDEVRRDDCGYFLVTSRGSDPAVAAVVAWLEECLAESGPSAGAGAGEGEGEGNARSGLSRSG